MLCSVLTRIMMARRIAAGRTHIGWYGLGRSSIMGPHTGTLVLVPVGDNSVGSLPALVRIS